MNYKLLLMLPLMAIVFTGCHHDCDDGRIPHEYIDDAQQYMGKYKGEFDGKYTEMDVYMQYDKPYVVVQNDYGNDLIGQDCHSQVGQLQEVVGYQNNGQAQLAEATFQFDEGYCYGAGDELELKFGQDQRQVQATIQSKKGKRYTGHFYRY